MIEKAENLVFQKTEQAKKILLSIKTNNPVVKADLDNILKDIDAFLDGRGISLNTVKNKVGTLYWRLDISISDDPSEREFIEKYSYYRKHDDIKTIKQNVEKLYKAYKLLSEAIGIAFFGA